jgi:predicted  nucleic acid-binding Zn-ribbon protein
MSKDNNNISNKELLDAVSDGFSKLEEKIQDNREAIQDNREAIDDLEERLEKKIDGLDQKVNGLRNSLDAEILRYTDQHADHEERITALEEKVEV